MIKNLQLINFKSFQDQSISFKPLTLLSGLNSTGKSSVLQALMLLRRSYQRDFLPNKGLILNDEQVYIGTGQDALFEYAEDELIGFEIDLENEHKGIWCFNYAKELDVLKIASEKVDDKIYKSRLFNDKKFYYLKAERIGPQISYPMSEVDVIQKKQLGINGEYATHFLDAFGNKDIHNKKLIHPKAKSLSLKDQVDAWMGEISPGISIKTEPNLQTQRVRLIYSFKESRGYSPFNVGFGVTYTLPILVAILAAEPETLIIVENPESHLHPKGQSQMGELLGIAASCGIQIVVETHSDHVLDGICLAVKHGEINSKEVQIHYFKREKIQGKMLTEIISPNIDQDGRIDEWPEGFFDQRENDLMELTYNVRRD